MQQVTIASFRHSDTRLQTPVIAWCSICLGGLSGLILGLWSFGGPFPVPDWIGEYDSLPRRFLRLAHVAMFALGILHMLVVRQIAAAPIHPDVDRIAASTMALGNILMPLALIGAAVWEPIKYLTPVPAFAITTALLLAAFSAIRQTKGGQDDQTRT